MNSTLLRLGLLPVACAVVVDLQALYVLLASASARISALRTHDFDRARSLGTLGPSMVLLLFMSGFVTVGGEWFQMWRSIAWNGLDPAFRNTVYALFGLVLMHLPSESWVGRDPR